MNDQNEERQDPIEAITSQLPPVTIDLTSPPVPIGEILDELMPQGEPSSVPEWEDKKIVIRSVRPFEGQYGPAAFVVFTDENGELFNFVIGHKVILPKLFACLDRLPVAATIIKVEGGQYGEYYDIE